MATQLKNIVEFAAVAAGASLQLPHGLNVEDVGVIPDFVDFDNGNFELTASDATNLTMQNNGGAVGTCQVLAELWHSVARVFPGAVTPRPFVGGGGGTGGSISNPLILKTVAAGGDVSVTASSAHASGAIGDGGNVAAGVSDVSVDPAGMGLAMGYAFSYAGQNARVGVDGLGGFAHGYVTGALGYVGDPQIEASVEGAAAHGFAVCFGGDAHIEAASYGSTAFGAATSTNNNDADIRATGIGAFASGYAYSTAVGPAHILASYYGSRAAGRVSGGYIEAGGYGSFARGSSVAAGSILADDSGAFAGGYVHGAGSLIHAGAAYEDAYGSFAHGYAKTGAEIRAEHKGATAFGYAADTNGEIFADEEGAFASGYANDSTITAGGKGATAHGAAIGGGGANIGANAYGAFATGTVRSEGSINSGADGAFASGYAYGTACQVTANNQGAHALGTVFSATYATIIQARGEGAFAGGYATAGGEIDAYGQGAFAFGFADDLGEIASNGDGAFAGGNADNNDVLASADGAFAFGDASGANITASGLGAFAFGQTSEGTPILASGNGAAQFGAGTNAVDNSLQINERFLATRTGFAGRNFDRTLGVGAASMSVQSNVMTITGDGGANVIGTITGGIDGQELTLIFVDGLVTITDTAGGAANTIDLAGAIDFVSADDSVLKLVFDGTSWFEISRSVN